jgi:hypothetical protein
LPSSSHHLPDGLLSEPQFVKEEIKLVRQLYNELPKEDQLMYSEVLNREEQALASYLNAGKVSDAI